MVNVYQPPPPQALYAICYMAMNGIFGTIKLSQMDPAAPINITYDIKGLPPGLHGFHVHEFGDTGNNCTNAGAHLNPFDQPHGDKTDEHRHMGDMGNIIANPNGTAAWHMTIYGYGPNLYFPTCMGRAIVVHELEDDLGRGDNQESKITGNSGKRLACCTIGLAKPEQPPPQAYPPPPPHPMRPPPPATAGKEHGEADEHYPHDNNK